MVNVYQRVTNAIKTLENRLDFKQVIMPIGLDGAVAYHILHYSWERRGVKPEDHLGNTLQITSRFNEVDEVKFSRIMQHAQVTDKVVYGLDVRTKTGTLGTMLRSRVIPGVKFLYVVLFDPGLHADIRGTREELTDEDRRHIYWVSSFEAEREFIRREGESWVYNLNHDVLSGLNYVQSIKEFL